MHRHVVMNMF